MNDGGVIAIDEPPNANDQLVIVCDEPVGARDEIASERHEPAYARDEPAGVRACAVIAVVDAPGTSVDGLCARDHGVNASDGALNVSADRLMASAYQLIVGTCALIAAANQTRTRSISALPKLFPELIRLRKNSSKKGTRHDQNIRRHAATPSSRSTGPLSPYRHA